MGRLSVVSHSGERFLIALFRAAFALKARFFLSAGQAALPPLLVRGSREKRTLSMNPIAAAGGRAEEMR